MARASQLRIETLTAEERREPNVMVTVRVPKSWRDLLAKDGIISDKLLLPLAGHVKRLRGEKVRE